MSDLNIAVIVREKIPVETKAFLMEKLGPDVSPLFLTVEDLRQLIESGEFIAHEVVRGGKILYADERVSEVMSKLPPLNQRTRDYLRSHSLACLGLSLENYFSGRYSQALNYAFKSLRSACRFIAAGESQVLLSDREIVDFLGAKGMAGAKEVYLQLRDARFKGVKKGELFPLIVGALKTSLTVLGINSQYLEAALEVVEKEFRWVSDVKVRPGPPGSELRVSGVDLKGNVKEVSLPL